MSAPNPSPPRRHRRAFLAAAAGTVLTAAGFGLTEAVRRVRMAASRSKDL